VEERTILQPSTTGSVKPGTRLNGVYEIEKLIGHGGMGEVYRGFNIQTRDIVAIKMVRPELMNNPEVFELFRREASILHNLTHEAIVRYFVFSVAPEIRRAYLAMEFVDGQSLTKRLASGPLPLTEIRILRRRIAYALEAAHRLGVVHRDVSPDNIILPNDSVRKAKIIDFGIARFLSLSKQTIIGDGFAGKYDYVSPEQLGVGGGQVTFKSDIYSFGLVLAQAARGSPLDMGGSQADLIEKRRAIPNLSDVDRSIRPLIQAMLEPLPEKRPSSMAAVAEWGERPRANAGEASFDENEARERAPPGGHLAAILGALIAVVSVAGAGYVFRDDLAQWMQPHVAPAPQPSHGGESPLAEPFTTGTVAVPPLTEPLKSATESISPSLAPPSSEPSVTPPTAVAPHAQHAPSTDELVDAAPPHATASLVELPQATAATPYRAELPAFSDYGGKGLKLAADSLPQGLAFEDLGDGKSVIQGAPVEAGSAAVRVVATNHAGRTAQMTATLVIADLPKPSPPSGVKPVPPATPPAPPSSMEARLETPVQALPDQKAPPIAAAPVPEARLETPPHSTDRERLFVQAYHGGQCFLVKAMPGERAYLGVGDQLEPFQRFEKAFTQELDAEPHLSLRLITTAECPALDLIRVSANVPHGSPRIELAEYSIGRNRPLTGKIVNLAGRRAYLVLVDNDGVAYRLDADLQSDSETATFSVPLTPDPRSTGPLQVVMAIVSTNPIPALETLRSGPLKALAPPLIEAARAGSASVGAEFIRFAD
jgi:serine/threonine-protein kinase